MDLTHFSINYCDYDPPWIDATNTNAWPETFVRCLMPYSSVFMTTYEKVLSGKKHDNILAL